MITGTVAHLRLEQALQQEPLELTDGDLDDIWHRWLHAFAGSGKGDGWLDQLDDAPRRRAKRLPGWLPEAVAALSWLVVQPGSDYRERVVTFQPVLDAALTHGLLDPTDMTARYLSVVTGHEVTRRQVDDQILTAVEFIDDDLWCARTRQDLDLNQLKLKAPPGAVGIQVRLNVSGITDPLFDPRVPCLVTAARHYRRCDGVAVYASTRVEDRFITGETSPTSPIWSPPRSSQQRRLRMAPCGPGRDGRGPRRSVPCGSPGGRMTDTSSHAGVAVPSVAAAPDAPCDRPLLYLSTRMSVNLLPVLG